MYHNLLLCKKFLNTLSLCILLFSLNPLESIKINNGRLNYSISIKSPSELLGKLVNKLVNVSTESYNRAKKELYVEDVNGTIGKPVKLFLVLEQSDLFKRCNNTNYSEDGSEISFSDHDKVLLPPSFFECLKDGDYNVPFQLLVHKIHNPQEVIDPKRSNNLANKGPKKDFIKLTDKEETNECTIQSNNEDYISQNKISEECISCSAIEFRTDENYIYLPKWIINNLKLKPYDIVLVEPVKLSDCTNVELKCLEKGFYDLKNVKKILEDRLKYYSTLTLNSVIPITVDKKTYNFQVVKLDTAEHQNVNHVSIQDVDINLKLL
uniref:Ubiquitin-fusion degradation pathway component, UFD1 homologue, putative n=1 Tax=Theileria annulata TaxID=5874 RepID=A0A3B0MVU5_THEAN